MLIIKIAPSFGPYCRLQTIRANIHAVYTAECDGLKAAVSVNRSCLAFELHGNNEIIRIWTCDS